MPPKVEGTVSIVSANPAPIGSTATFHVESDSDDLFVHVQARKDGVLVLEGWQRWFGHDLSFNLDSPNLMDAGPPADGVALLEDWSKYSKSGRTPQVDEVEFEIV